jgi:hypothetical protein
VATRADLAVVSTARDQASTLLRHRSGSLTGSAKAGSGVPGGRRRRARRRVRREEADGGGGAWRVATRRAAAVRWSGEEGRAMPDPDTVRTDNPEVVRLLMAHEIAKAAAALSVDAYNRGPRADVEAYLAVFDTVYTAIRATSASGRPVAPEEDVQKGGQAG